MIRGLGPTLALALGAWSVPAHAAIHPPRLGLGNGDASTSVLVGWNTDEDRPSVVRVRAGDGAWVLTEGTSERWEPVGQWVHTVELTGLRPATEHTYQAGDGNEWSVEHALMTGPTEACAPFRFIALGDDRSQDDFGPDRNWAPILEESLGDDPAFVLNGGDLVKEGSQHEQWLHWLEMTDDGFSSVAHLPTIGNHDDDRVDGDAAHYNVIFPLPRNDDSNTEDYFASTYGDLLVLSLSTATFKGNAFQEQAAWMDRVLTENPRPWKIVFFHHPIYTSTMFGLLHPPNEEGQNAALVPIFDRHHVDLVIQSHNHWYERFHPSFGGAGGEEAQPVDGEANGTVYVTTGGAGAVTADLGGLISDQTFEEECGRTQGCATLKGDHHYILFELAGNTLTATVKATAAQTFGESDDNRAIIDEFRLEKAGEERIDCDAGPPEEGEGEPPPEGEGEGEGPGEGEGEGPVEGEGEGGHQPPGEGEGEGPAPPLAEGEGEQGEGGDSDREPGLPSGEGGPEEDPVLDTSTRVQGSGGCGCTVAAESRSGPLVALVALLPFARRH